MCCFPLFHLEVVPLIFCNNTWERLFFYASYDCICLFKCLKKTFTTSNNIAPLQIKPSSQCHSFDVKFQLLGVFGKPLVHLIRRLEKTLKIGLRNIRKAALWGVYRFQLWLLREGRVCGRAPQVLLYSLAHMFGRIGALICSHQCTNKVFSLEPHFKCEMNLLWAVNLLLKELWRFGWLRW